MLFVLMRPPPAPTLFPYTTLFRSIVDLPDITDRLRRSTGVDLRSVAAVEVAGRAAKPLEGRGTDASEAGREAARGTAGGALSWVTFLEYHDWTSGEPGTLLVTTQLNIQDVYGRISA